MPKMGSFTKSKKKSKQQENCLNIFILLSKNLPSDLANFGIKYLSAPKYPNNKDRKINLKRTNITVLKIATKG